MSKRSLWRLLITLLICGGCAYFFIPTSKIRLGLDLRGGVHFELEVQSQEALVADLRDSRDKLQDRLQEKQLSGLVSVDGPALKLEGVPEEQKGRVDKLLSDSFSNYETSFNAGTYKITQKAGYQAYLKDDANKRALQIIENRINMFGVAEPEITQTGSEGNRIVVELPGIDEAEQARIKNLLSTPGRLEQRILAKQDTMGYHGYPSRESALAAFGGQVPPGTELVPELETDRDMRRAGQIVVPGQKIEEKIKCWHLVEVKTYVNGADIITANETINPNTDANEIHYTLNRKGGDDFYALTTIASEQSRLIAILLDGKAVSVLSCRDKIRDSVSITGSFTKEEAKDFAMKLRSGAMRASMKFLEERNIGPGLGSDSINAGMRAAIIGFAVVVGFMLYFYRWSGLNAITALTVNIIVMLGLLGSFHAVITLPGIAGFALTIGMAVDANILIFERIKEELRAGKSVAGAIQAGFQKVFWTIVDSHVTQLFAALLLFIFGTGAVKGFAVTLTVGVVASLFTSIYISHFIYDWVLERHPGTATISVGTHSYFENSKFDFMRWKGVALAISWGIILACIISAQPWKGSKSHMKFGMQFTGGVDMLVRFKGQMTQEHVRAALAKGGISNAAVVPYAAQKDFQDFSIKVKAAQGQDEKDASAQKSRIREILRGLDPGAANDPRPDLNTEDVERLTDQWMKTNPLGVANDTTLLHNAYQPWVSKIAATRGKLSFISSYDQLPSDMPAQLKSLVQKEYRLGNLSVLKSESFSPSISGEWTSKTIQAVLWAMGAILVYVILRFTVSFSVGGIVALIHDLLMALGLFVLFRFEFSVPVVASFLILLGYSMADTIVVFDRIRENSHKPEYRRATITQLVNDSINQTLSRTILTSMSVLFVAFCLFAFGGPALRDLAFPIFVGVITGTYSSIYIASPVVVYWERWFGHKDNLKQKHV